VVKCTLATLKQLKSFADFNAPKATEPERSSTTNKFPPTVTHMVRQFDGQSASGRIGMNLSYTINLNLPATSDQAVFNAIFRSLKEHLLTDEE
jgi:hypothetical protein